MHHSNWYYSVVSKCETTTGSSTSAGGDDDNNNSGRKSGRPSAFTMEPPCLGCAYDTHHYYGKVLDRVIMKNSDEYCLLRDNRNSNGPQSERIVASLKVTLTFGNYASFIQLKKDRVVLRMPAPNYSQICDIRGQAASSLIHIRQQLLLFFAVNTPCSFVEITLAFLCISKSLAIDVRFMQYTPIFRNIPTIEYCDICFNSVCNREQMYK
ncbi:hypothetical protein [Heliothis virescens ascovirus 3g]|uniref:Uncharacterized protein n=1 Tax=Heliothis virescens ascovirus 3g TaxID=1246651 RepID=K4NW69_9VIRU|nr:hypothetical protein F8204_gp156 [Heliothis virescens ascovirus 3g]AFV50408.1 hypothetical protein [Heliothis virescens ascovirus 3g]